jgi:hypothetical protein
MSIIGVRALLTETLRFGILSFGIENNLEPAKEIFVMSKEGNTCMEMHAR